MDTNQHKNTTQHVNFHKWKCPHLAQRLDVPAWKRLDGGGPRKIPQWSRDQQQQSQQYTETAGPQECQTFSWVRTRLVAHHLDFYMDIIMMEISTTELTTRKLKKIFTNLKF
jgi:hypothetical protein